MQYSVAVANARLDAIETRIGPGPFLRIYSGEMPTEFDKAPINPVLCQIRLPSDWMQAASNGQKEFGGVWPATEFFRAGVPTFFYMFDGGLNVIYMVGTVSAPGGGGDLIVSQSPITNQLRTIRFTIFDKTL